MIKRYDSQQTNGREMLIGGLMYEKENGKYILYYDLEPILKKLEDLNKGYDQLAQVSADVSDELDKCKLDLKEMIETKQFIA